MTRRFLPVLLGLCLAAGARAGTVTNEETSIVTSAPPVRVSPPPALVGLILGAGTAALILSGHDSSDDLNDEGDGGLAAPELDSPPDGVEIVDGGGSVAFEWRPVVGAAAYLLDVDTCDATNNACADYRLEMSPDVALTVGVPSPVAGRWRVRAVDTGNIAGPFSAFRTFTYRGPLPLP
jgi:hypothetical protein